MALQRKLTKPELDELRMKMENDGRRLDEKRAEFIRNFTALPENEKARVIFELLRRLEKVEEYIEAQKNSSHDTIF